MLSEDDSRHEADESAEALGALEAAMLALVARHLLKLEGGGPAAANAGAVRLAVELRAEAAARSKKVGEAIARDAEGSLVLSAIADAEGAGEDAGKYVDAARSRSTEVSKAVRSEADAYISNMQVSARAAYLAAAGRAAGRVNAVGWRPAVQEAVADLARRGVSCCTYARTNPDGSVTQVRVPVDVGIRRAVHNAGRRAQMEQALEIAERSGQNLVEVSWTGNPRPSHQAWEGGIYQLRGSSARYRNFYEACHAGDPVDGIGGYNCGHTFTIYREGMPRAYGDPLEGTGYSKDEAYRLTSKQARLESAVRKEKRAAEVLRASGLDDRASRARIRSLQGQLRELVAEHPQVLKRRIWRESIYEKARREAGALGVVHLDKAQAAAVGRARDREAARYSAARGEWQDRTLGDLSVNRGSQEKHIEGTDAYRRKVEKVRREGFAAPSRVTVSVEECERLVRERAGTGRPLTTWRGEWSKKEVCYTEDVVGYYVDREGRESRTRYFTIHYGKSGTHIVPYKDQGALFDED